MCKDNRIVGLVVVCETHAFGLSILQIVMILTVEKTIVAGEQRDDLRENIWKLGSVS